MACGGCGKGRQVGDPYSSAKPQLIETGIYPLYVSPDCTEKYHGAWQGASIFVVALGTENERLYRKGERMEADRLARKNGWTLDHLPAVDFCHDTMQELLGA